MLRNTLSNAIELSARAIWQTRKHKDIPNNKRDLSGDGFFDTRSGQRWARRCKHKVFSISKVFISDIRNEDGRGGSSSLLYGIAHCSKHRSVQMCGSSFLGVRSTNDLGTLYV